MTSDDGPEPDYCVIEEVPPEKDLPDENKPFEPFDPAHLQWSDLSEYDDRMEILSIDLESVKVHIVNAVQFDTSDFKVTRHRWTKTNSVF